jgi:hypothetical protein
VIGETRGVCSASHKVGGASGRPARSRRCSSERPCRPSLPARRRRSRLGQASAIPPPARRRRTGRRSARRLRLAELLEDLEPDRALPGDDVRIVEARHHGCARSRASARRSPRGFGPAVVEDDLGALRARAFDLDRRRVGRHDDDRGMPSRRRRSPRPAHDCPTRKRPRPAPAPPRSAAQPVGRAAQLERAAGLQAFAFQPHALAPISPRSAASARPGRRSARRLRARHRLRFTCSMHQPPEFPRFRQTVAQRGQGAGTCHGGSRKPLLGGTPPHISRPAAPWDFQPQGSFRQLRRKALGGPLSCTSIIARWG